MSALTRHALFLRAINTGDRRVRNEELVAALGCLGMHDIAAYQAAGNLTFRATADAVPDEVEIGDHLTERLGFECPAFVRSWADLHEMATRCPFTADERAATDDRVQVTFLASPASTEIADAVAELVPDEDRVVVGGREWWWLPRAGISSSALKVGAVERLVGPMTMRTLATIERFVAKFPD